MENNIIPSQLKEIQDRASISRDELAQLLCTSLVAIDQWEREVSSPSIKQKELICSILDQINKGGKIRRPKLVLQNGTFPSRGSKTSQFNFSQDDLFNDINRTNLFPRKSIISEIKDDIFFDDGKKQIDLIFKDHNNPAKTVSKAVKIEVSAGKNTYTYDAHTYHTKVPPQGIVEFLEVYLPDGGLVLDPFAGSGMTGVAARIKGMDVIINELSPAACFIGYNFTESTSPTGFLSAINTLLEQTKSIRKDLYLTHCRECGKPTEIQYTIWSYRVLCPLCNSEFTLWDHCRSYGKTVKEHKILKEFSCPSCGELIKKRDLERKEAIPVLIGYKCCRKSQVEHPLSDEDIAKIEKSNSGSFLVNGYYPTNKLPEGVNLNQPKRHGLTSIDRFYTTRNLSAMSQLWMEIHKINDIKLASAAAFVFTSLYQRVTKLSEFRFWGGSGNTANFNVPFIFNEANVFITFERKAKNIYDHLFTTASKYKGRKAIVCNSATNLSFIPENSIDLIFTDPPFGANINYSEMNILWESWLGEYTDTTKEAIINRAQGKNITSYEELMFESLAECYRVLRPGHWMLLVFMNSSSEVWKAIRSAVNRAGFLTERLDIFDKQHGTFKQFVSENTAGCDLVLHCRKPLVSNDIFCNEKYLTCLDSIKEFFDNRKKEIPFTEFLHVDRESELDLRRLYSEWLAFSIPKNHELEDFMNFREHAKQIFSQINNTK